METILIAVLVALVSVVIGSGFGFQINNLLSAKSQRAVDEASAQQLRRADARSKEILLEAKEQALKVRSDTEAKLNEQQLDIQRQQSRLEAREETLQNKSELIENAESDLSTQVINLEKQKTKIDDLKLEAKEKLENMLRRENRWELAQKCFLCIPVFAELDQLRFTQIFEH